MLAISSTTSAASLGKPFLGKPVAEDASRPVVAPVSSRAREDRFEASGQAPEETADTTATGLAELRDKNAADEAQGKKSANGELTPDERRMVSELQARDREVRAHEAAHQAAGGGYVGGASYTYQQGPDGRQYAIGGEVSVDLSTSGSSPEQIIAKMEQIRAAALAPADPSPQDYSVAAAADAIAAQARRDLQKQRTEGADKADLAKPTSSQDGASGQGGDLVVKRAVDAYRQAQETGLSQSLINQRA